jgi:hypothetical protein
MTGISIPRSVVWYDLCLLIVILSSDSSLPLQPGIILSKMPIRANPARHSLQAQSEHFQARPGMWDSIQNGENASSGV